MCRDPASWDIQNAFAQSIAVAKLLEALNGSGAGKACEVLKDAKHSRAFQQAQSKSAEFGQVRRAALLCFAVC
jgi:hypothetical protein